MLLMTERSFFCGRHRISSRRKMTMAAKCAGSKLRERPVVRNRRVGRTRSRKRDTCVP